MARVDVDQSREEEAACDADVGDEAVPSFRPLELEHQRREDCEERQRKQRVRARPLVAARVQGHVQHDTRRDDLPESGEQQRGQCGPAALAEELVEDFRIVAGARLDELRHARREELRNEQREGHRDQDVVHVCGEHPRLSSTRRSPLLDGGDFIFSGIRRQNRVTTSRSRRRPRGRREPRARARRGARHPSCEWCRRGAFS